MTQHPTLEVLFTPAEFAALADRDLRETVCVVFDVLRATSTMVAALANGAKAMVPVEEISDALAQRKKYPGALLAGERGGMRIQAGLTGGIDFDLGNSPREFRRETVAGKTIIMTTTNGTKALRACMGARRVLAGSFLNLQAMADFLTKEPPSDLLLVCGGTGEQAAYEDALCAGALCDLFWEQYGEDSIADSALMARNLFLHEEDGLVTAFQQSRNARNLLKYPELRDDVTYCAQRDLFDLVPQMGQDGRVISRG